MEDLLSKEHYCYEIHTLLMKSSAYYTSVHNPSYLVTFNYIHLPNIVDFISLFYSNRFPRKFVILTILLSIRECFTVRTRVL